MKKVKNDDLNVKKCAHVFSPEVKRYLKQKKKIRLKNREKEEENQIRKENRRLSQLKYLDIITKQIIEKPKKKKKKSLHRVPEVKRLNQSSLENDKEEAYQFELSKISNKSQDGRQFKALGNFSNYEFFDPEVNATNLGNDILSKKSLPEVVLPKSSATLPLNNSDDSLNSKNKTDNLKINRLINEKNKIIQQNLEKRKAATKIQAWFRGCLSRQATAQYKASIHEQRPMEFSNS